MKIKNLTKDEQNQLANLDIEMTNDEIMFFVGFAMNQLLQAGMVKFNELQGAYELDQSVLEAMKPTEMAQA